jgi:hypothetical protein
MNEWRFSDLPTVKHRENKLFDERHKEGLLNNTGEEKQGECI